MEMLSGLKRHLPTGDMSLIFTSTSPTHGNYLTLVRSHGRAEGLSAYCSTAAEKAVKEVESRLREKFSELKPGAAIPPKIGDVIGALISENGVFRFCDTTTTSGRDYRRGIHSLFEGIMAAYRNPAAHANLQYEKREAMEQIMLASQLMYVLEKPQL